MEPLFCVRQLIEKFKEKKKKICMVFINLERVLTKVLNWAFMKKEVQKYINLIQDINEGSRTSIKILYVVIEYFHIKVSVH